MLGRRDPQRKLFSAAQQLGEATLKEMGFYGKLASEGYKMFRDEDFLGAYYHGHRGRVSGAGGWITGADAG